MSPLQKVRFAFDQGWHIGDMDGNRISVGDLLKGEGVVVAIAAFAIESVAAIRHSLSVLVALWVKASNDLVAQSILLDVIVLDWNSEFKKSSFLEIKAVHHLDRLDFYDRMREFQWPIHEFALQHEFRQTLVNQ